MYPPVTGRTLILPLSAIGEEGGQINPGLRGHKKKSAVGSEGILFTVSNTSKIEGWTFSEINFLRLDGAGVGQSRQSMKSILQVDYTLRKTGYTFQLEWTP